MLFVLFLTGCDGQRDARSFTYKLHNPQNDDQYSTLHSMPDGALLVVSKRVEQPKQIWNLLRIAAWDGSQPREDKLDVDVRPNNELLGCVYQEDLYDRSDQLLMDPGGNYLVVRLTQDADSWNVNPDGICKAAGCPEHYRSPRVQASPSRRAHRSSASRRRYGFQSCGSLHGERLHGAPGTGY